MLHRLITTVEDFAGMIPLSNNLTFAQSTMIEQENFAIISANVDLNTRISYTVDFGIPVGNISDLTQGNFVLEEGAEFNATAQPSFFVELNEDIFNFIRNASFNSTLPPRSFIVVYRPNSPFFYENGTNTGSLIVTIVAGAFLPPPSGLQNPIDILFESNEVRKPHIMCH